MIAYPEMVDLQAVTTLIDIVKNRQIAERQKEFGLCAWNVQGYLQKIFIGVPLQESYGQVYAHSGKIQDGLEELEEVLSDYETTVPQVFTAENEKDRGDIVTILMIVNTVLTLLRTLGFLKKKEEDE